jgi:DNA-binding transcriptional MerR regulator
VVPEPVVQTEPVDLTEALPIPKKRGRKPKDRSLIMPKAPMKRGRKSLDSTESDADLFNIPPDDVLFKKQYYPMGEVAEMFKINHSLLRFWEKEFDILQPRKNKKGDRLFRPEDIKNLQLIHHLIRERKYTVKGAQDYLKNNSAKAVDEFSVVRSLEKVKSFLIELKSALE